MRSNQTRATSVGAGSTLRRTKPICAQACHPAMSATGNTAYCANKSGKRGEVRTAPADDCSARSSARAGPALLEACTPSSAAMLSVITRALPCRQLRRRLAGRFGEKRKVDVAVDAVGVVLLHPAEIAQLLRHRLEVGNIGPVIVREELPLLHGNHRVRQAGILSLQLDPQVRIAHEPIRSE